MAENVRESFRQGDRNIQQEILPEVLSYFREEFDPNAMDTLTAVQLLTPPEQVMHALIVPLGTVLFQISETSLLGQISESHANQSDR